MADLAEEYSARAATFRRLALELKSEEGRSALLAIAEQYETEASARRGASGKAPRRP